MDRMRKTSVSIVGEDVYINGLPTYAGRFYREWRIEGLLLNARMVQATFDDLNPATRSLWNEPDGRPFDTVPGYHGQPVIVNEDDHFDFDQPDNNFLAALSKQASWGLFDYRKPGEGFEAGFQSVPTDWSTSSARKQGFFTLLKEVTGS